MPNPYKADVRSRLVHTLNDTQTGRRAGGGSSAGGAGATRTRGSGTVTATTTVPDEPQVVAKTRVKKVLKKPPPKCEGGKLGTGDP
jgi:hypothetical protein